MKMDWNNLNEIRKHNLAKRKNSKDLSFAIPDCTCLEKTCTIHGYKKYVLNFIWFFVAFVELKIKRVWIAGRQFFYKMNWKFANVK